MFGIFLVFLMALVVPAACDIVFNGGDAQWNDGAATGNTIKITSPLTYTITVDGSWQHFIFDETVINDGIDAQVGCTDLQYTIDGTAATFFTRTFGDNRLVVGDITANDGYLSPFFSVPVTVGQTIVIPPQTITCGGNDNFNPQYNSLVFTGNTFLIDSVNAMKLSNDVSAKAPPAITIELDTQPDSDVDVQFTHNVAPNGGFTLDDDFDATYDNSVTLTPDAPGQYTITLPAVPANFQLEAIECDSDDVTVQLDQRRVLVDFDDKNIVCTFVVVALGSCCSQQVENACVTNISEQECLDIDSGAAWTLDGDCNIAECPRGACCDEGSCHITLDETECSGGVFQGVGSDCSGDTCPIGNVCCQDDVEQPCLTGENDVEQCTGVGQFAADDCGECLRRFSDFALSILSSSEFISLSDDRKRDVESSSSSSSSSSSYSSSSSSTSSSSSSHSSSSSDDADVSINMAIAIRNRTPQTYEDVVIEVDASIPLHARISSSTVRIGTFEWSEHSVHGTTVKGRGQWTIPQLAAKDYQRLTFDVELSEPAVNDEIVITTNVVSSHPAALVVEQTKTVTIVQ